MAIIGMTKLDAVNACLMAIGEYRVTVLDPTGTSIQSDAERVVDESTRYFCAMGWPCNTRRSVAATPSGASNTIVITTNIPTGTIRVKSAGPSQHRNLVLRGDTIFDSDNGTTNFGSAAVVYFDIAELLDFEDLEPILKEEVALHASQRFARRRSGSQLTDAYISQELTQVDELNTRNGTFLSQALFAPQIKQQGQ